MDFAVGSDEYAEMLSNEVYDRLLIYIVNGMFDTSNKIIKIKGKAFKRRISEAWIRANNNLILLILKNKMYIVVTLLRKESKLMRYIRLDGAH